MFVVGTAGHVDHGKSTLVQALTGIDPDRLREEKTRGMTIELGFAWLELPSGTEVSIVDVPGHERFIKNMLMGAGGVDVALLIVAADEGVMPQTREHLAIFDLLGVSNGLVVMTKKDLVDQDWLDLVTLDVQETLEGTTLEDAEVVAVCDHSSFLLGVLNKNNGVKVFKDFKKMIDSCDLDCVVVSTPTKSHAEIVRYALECNIHVFCEKPFCLNIQEGKELVKLAGERNLINQVGYHCRFAGVFQKNKELLSEGAIGEVYYFKMEVYGNVVKKKQGKTWRSKKIRRRRLFIRLRFPRGGFG